MDYYEKKVVKAYCNECYDGVIVEDNEVKGVFFCNRCFKECKIKKFEDEK